MVQAPRTPGWAASGGTFGTPVFCKNGTSCDEVAEAGGGAVVIAPVKVVSLIAPFPVLGTLTRKIFSSVAEVLTGNSLKLFGSARLNEKREAEHLPDRSYLSVDFACREKSLAVCIDS